MGRSLVDSAAGSPGLCPILLGDVGCSNIRLHVLWGIGVEERLGGQGSVPVGLLSGTNMFPT